jgi:hypothetical protein
MARYLMIIGCVIGVYIICFGVYGIHSNGAKLGRYRQLAANGVQTSGKITDNTSTSEWYNGFVFQVDGKSYSGRSKVNQADWGRVGDPISVIYLPEDPTNCRAVASIGQREAALSYDIGWFFLFVGFSWPLVQWAYCRRLYKT